MPTPTPYTSLSGLKYVSEKPLDEIITKMMTPQEEESSDDNEEDKEVKEAEEAPLSPKSAKDQKASALGNKK